MSLSPKAFRAHIYDYYRIHGRHDMPWRQPDTDGRFNPYHILVSEIMLQQTQVSRVIPKYQSFLRAFPDVKHLADAPLSAVLQQWVGLGYNRRAKYLHEAAQMIMTSFDGVFPRDANLRLLPGVGPNTAGAIMVYAFNEPVAFIETNIRTLYIHYYFNDADSIHDRDLMPIIERTIDLENPRQWYWALMDNGSHLKATVGNKSRLSAHYAAQPAFHGSVRQVRGAIIRMLSEQASTSEQLKKVICDERIDTVLQKLEHEQLIIREGNLYHL